MMYVCTFDLCDEKKGTASDQSGIQKGDSLNFI